MVVSGYMLAKAQEIGMTEEDLHSALRKSKKTVHHAGNREYGNYVFSVQNGELIDINKL